MKLKKILTGMLLIVSSVAFAQHSREDSLVAHYYKYPKQAVEEAETLYQQAIREHNNPLLIKALILKTTFSLRIDQQKYPQLLKELEEYIEREKDVSSKSILHSYVGQLYDQYYRDNRYAIHQRTDLQGPAPEDINEWSANLFKEKIYGHFMTSIAPQKVLQETPVAGFNLIMIGQNAADSLRPTLYDFLCHRAIDCLSRDYTSRADKDLIPLSELYAPASVFVKIPLTVVPLDATSHMLKIWQDLLAFRLQAGDKDALLMADLERLSDIGRGRFDETGDSLYFNALQELEKQYASTPMVVEVMAREAEMLNRNEEDKQKKLQALAICEKGMRMYPHYKRINLLQEIINEVKEPQINTRFAQTIYPGEKLSVKISSKNIRNLTLTLYRVNMDLLSYQTEKDKRNATIPKTRIYRHTYPLAADLISRDTVVEVPVSASGLYEVVMTVPGAKQNISGYFISTRLFTTHQSTEKQYHFRVCDWQTGKPVNRAKVLIYNYKYPKHILVDSLYTNSEGAASYNRRNYSNIDYQVINSENPHSYLQTAYPLTRRSDNSRIQIKLITDRKIYRPGQTVYYKGITWKATKDTIYALRDRKYEVIFRDANRKEIGRQNRITNDFGSFSGSFVIPQNTLNGYFTLSAGDWSTAINVAEYKRPEFEITFTESNRSYFTGDTIRVQGKVKSFSGINLSYQPVKYEITPYSYFYRMSASDKVIQGITQTNANGEFEVNFRAEPPRYSFMRERPYYYSITATVTDSKGETQKSSLTVPVYSGLAKPVIDIPEQVNKQVKTAFRITLEDVAPGEEARTVQYSLSKLVTPAALGQALDTVIEKTLLRGEVQISREDTVCPVMKDYTPGAYLFTVSCGGVKADRIFYLYSPDAKRPPIPTYKWLVKDKTSCLPGETAQVQFGTSAREAYVNYQVFAPGKLILQKQVVLSDEIITIRIPYKAEYGRQIWLCITYVKDKELIQEVIPIERVRENRKLIVETKVFRDRLQPGQQETWEIKVVTEQKQAAIAEVLAMMYDASLDKLMPYHISMKVDYLTQGFPYEWDRSYYFESDQYPGISRWGFRQKKLTVPSLSFEELNVYSYPAMLESRIVAFGTARKEDAAEARDGKVYIRGLASKTMANHAADAADAGGRQALQDVELRQNFQETAFFYPQLRTDSCGEVSIRFTLPESLTRWKFIAVANTQEMAVGQLERYITTSKPLMVRPNLPRFLRSGDQTELKVTVSNLSDTVQQGEARLELFAPESRQVIFSKKKTFRIASGQNQTLGFAFTVPADIDLAGCRITASSGRFSDGEQNLIPVLPDETLVTRTLPIYLQTAGEHSFSLKEHTPGKNYRLTFEYTGNPVWYAVLALPALTEPQHESVTEIAAAFYVNAVASNIARSNPKITEAIRNWNATGKSPDLLSKLEQNSELKSVLLEASPWVLEAQSETEQMQSLIQLFDQNRLDYLRQQALGKLAALQAPDGGWSWFKGMNSNEFITANVLVSLSRASVNGQLQYGAKEKTMQMKALRYLDKQIRKDFETSPKHIGYQQIVYLYTRSMYRDIPLGDALEAHKHFMALAQKQWGRLSLYEKAILAVAMEKYGLTDEARNIVKSLREYAVTSPAWGMYWPNNRNTFYRNSAVMIHTAIMEAFYTLEGNTPEVNRMKQWLLRQKQVQNWASIPSTVDAIYTLLLTGNDQLAQQDQAVIRLGQHKFSSSGANHPLGYIKESFSAGEIKPAMLKVDIKKETDQPSWGGLYLQRFEKLENIKEQKGELSVDKKLFISQTDKNGKHELVPLYQQPLKVGDKVVVRLTLSLKRDMEYLHLKDLRAACFEPADQLSGNHWQFGTVYYQEVKDAATNFFFSALSRGTYVIEYPVWVNQAGEYQDGIATFQSIYAPEYNAFSDATHIKIE